MRDALFMLLAVLALAFNAPPVMAAYIGTTVGTVIDLINPQTITGTTNFQGSTTATTSMDIGASGTPITQVVVYAPTISPANQSGNASGEQTATVTGLTTADIVSATQANINTGAGTGISGLRVSSSDTFAYQLGNATSSTHSIASGTWPIIAWRH